MLAAAGLGARDISKASSGKMTRAFASAEDVAEGGESGPIQA